MSKQKFLALVAALSIAGIGTAMADGSHWRSRPAYPSQPRVQVGVNVVWGAPVLPQVVQPWSVQPVVVWAPGYRAVYTPSYGTGYRIGYRPGYQPGYRGGHRDRGWRDHRGHRHHGKDRCDD